MTFTSSRPSDSRKGALGSFQKSSGFHKTRFASVGCGLSLSSSCMIFRKPVFQLWPEMPDETLNWPGSAVSQSADGVALNLFAQFPNHVNLLWLCVAFSEPPHHCVHPVNALSAWSALATRLVLVEHCKPCNCLNHICLFVHHDDSCCAKTSLLGYQVIKVHQNLVTHRFGDEGSRAATRDNTEEVVPASNDTATVSLYQLLQGNAHLLFHGAGVVHVARDVEKLGARVTSAAHTSKPITAPPADGGSNSNSFNIGDSGGAAKNSNISWEWGLQAGLSLLPLEALNQGSLLSTDVGASSTVHKQVKVITGAAGVGPKEAGIIGLLDSLLQVGGLIVELSSDVDVASPGAHGSTSNEAALNQGVRVVTHDLTILASSRLTFVSIDHQVFRATIVGLVHEAPLETAGESSSTPPSQATGLNLVNDPLATLLHNLLGLVPLPSLHGSLQPPVMAAINVSEDSVSVSHWAKLGFGLSCLAPGGYQLAACSGRTLDPLEEVGGKPLLNQLGHPLNFTSLSLVEVNQAIKAWSAV